MPKPKLYYSYLEQQPHEQQVYETRNYQTNLLDGLNAKSFEDEDDDFEDDDEENYEENSDIEKVIEEEEGFIPTQRWKTKIFREYFYKVMALAI